MCANDLTLVAGVVYLHQMLPGAFHRAVLRPLGRFARALTAFDFLSMGSNLQHSDPKWQNNLKNPQLQGVFEDLLSRAIT